MKAWDEPENHYHARISLIRDGGDHASAGPRQVVKTLDKPISHYPRGSFGFVVKVVMLPRIPERQRRLGANPKFTFSRGSLEFMVKVVTVLQVPER